MTEERFQAIRKRTRGGAFVDGDLIEVVYEIERLRRIEAAAKELKQAAHASPLWDNAMNELMELLP